jgi:heptosyltransferase I
MLVAPILPQTRWRIQKTEQYARLSPQLKRWPSIPELRTMNLSGKRILIVKPSSLGDVVHTLPLAHAIKRCYPTCHIGWIVQKGFVAMLESDPAVDEIIPVFIPSTSDPKAPRGAFLAAAKATWQVIRRLRKRFLDAPHDIVLDLHASFRSGLMVRTNPGGLRIGFADAKELNTWFQHELIVPRSDLTHAVDKNLAFAERLGCQVMPVDFRVHTSPAARTRVRKFLDQEGVDESQRLVYANPAARWETKFWTVEAWAELADRLTEGAGAAVVFAGGSGDEPYIRRIAARAKADSVLVAAAKLNLAESTALIEASDVYVGVDSGPMHIAAFLETPVIALFGPTDPAKVGPYGPGHRVIRRGGLDCLACRKRSCANRLCLEGLSAETVYQETVKLMGW